MLPLSSEHSLPKRDVQATSTLRVKVVPRASMNAITGWSDASHEELCVRVTAVADGGKANAAVIKLFARELKLAKAAVNIAQGTTSRHKLLVFDLSPAMLELWLRRFE
jgi:uncharacterized protein (TIGR00251 family)